MDGQSAKSLQDLYCRFMTFFGGRKSRPFTLKCRGGSPSTGNGLPGRGKPLSYKGLTPYYAFSETGVGQSRPRL